MAGLISGVENIGRGERRKRLFFGGFMGLAGIGLALGLILAQAHPLWRLTVALPVFLGGLGFFQARLKTCVMHAARGTCKLDQGTTPVTDRNLQAHFVKQAKVIVFLSLVFATLVTAAVTVLPL